MNPLTWSKQETTYKQIRIKSLRELFFCPLNKKSTPLNCHWRKVAPKNTVLLYPWKSSSGESPLWHVISKTQRVESQSQEAQHNAHLPGNPLWAHILPADSDAAAAAAAGGARECLRSAGHRTKACSHAETHWWWRQLFEMLRLYKSWRDSYGMGEQGHAVFIFLTYGT